MGHAKNSRAFASVMIVLCPWWKSVGYLNIRHVWNLMITLNRRGIAVVGQAFAVASARTARGVVRCSPRGDDGGGLRRVIARGDGRRCRGMGFGMLLASHASAGYLKEGIAGFCGRAASLIGSVLRMAAV
jgi:hypothetical protein